MKLKYLFQALKFACLPTLVVLVLLVFGFFDISKTIDFISSDKAFAVILRIVLVIAEGALIYIMYIEYEKDGEKESLINDPSKHFFNKNKPVNCATYVRDIKTNWGSNDFYFICPTKDENMVLIKRVEKN